MLGLPFGWWLIFGLLVLVFLASWFWARRIG